MNSAIYSNEEEISPASRPQIEHVWKNYSSVVVHNIEKHKIVSTESQIPEKYTVIVRLNVCDKPAYCMLGLSNIPLNLDERSYIGEKGLGVVGFCFSNVTALEGEWKWHNSQVSVGQEIKLIGDLSRVAFLVGDEVRQELIFSKTMDPFYLCAGLYGNCEYEIIDIVDNS